MKPEPLKGKINKQDWLTGQDLKLFYPEDVCAAVKWLKEQINKQSTTRGKAYKTLMKLIDEAFEDVIK